MTPAATIGKMLAHCAPSVQHAYTEVILGYLDPHVQEAVRNRQETHPRLPFLPSRGQADGSHGTAPGAYSREEV